MRNKPFVERQLDQNSDMKKYKLDVAVLGDAAVGKSAILQKWLKDEFSEAYRPTVSDMYENRTRRRKSLWDTSELDLKIYDTCGSMDFPAMHRVTISSADAFLIVYSVDSEKSFECAHRLVNEVSEIKDGERIPIVIVGNKADKMEDRKVSFEKGLQLAVEAKAPFMEVSAKTGFNVEDTFYTLWKRFDTLAFLSSPDFNSGRTMGGPKRFFGFRVGNKNTNNGHICSNSRGRSASFL